MANYNTLKTSIQEVIKTNGNKEITGQVLQDSLIAMINSFGAGYQFVGVATPETNPGTPDQNVFYIGGAGTYSNFGTSIVIPQGSLCVFAYNGDWVKNAISIVNVINDLITGGANNALSAEQGKVLNQELSQLDQEVNKLKQDVNSKLGGESINLFDGETIADYYVSYNGRLTYGEGSKVTKPIPIKPNTVYAYSIIGGEGSNSSYFQFLAEDGVTPIKPLNPSTSTEINYDATAPSQLFLSPSNARYAQFTTKLTTAADNTEVMQLIETDTLPTTYIPYHLELPYADLPAQLLTELAGMNGEIAGKASYVKQIGENLYDKTAEALDGRYIGTWNGSLQYNENCITTKPIPIKPNTVYAYSLIGATANSCAFRFLAENGTTKLQPLDPSTDEAIAWEQCLPSKLLKSPATAKYAQFTVKFTSQDIRNSVQLIETDTLPSRYYPYWERYIIPMEHLPKEVEDVVNDGQNPLKGLLIAYNGDSICEGRLSGSSANGGAYAKLIADKVNGEYSNRGVSGGILASEAPDGDPTRKVVLDVANMPQNADLVCFEGGINDYWLNVPLGDFALNDYTGSYDTTTLCGALESIIYQAMNRWPGKPIVFIIVHKVGSTAYSVNSAGYTFQQAHDKMIGVCAKWSIPVFDAFEKSGLNGNVNVQNAAYFINTDRTHPNADGYKKYYVQQLISLFSSILPIE